MGNLSTALSSTIPKADQSEISPLARLQSPRIQQDAIDKKIMSNLLVQYFSAPSSEPRRDEILNLMTSILDFSDEDKQRVSSKILHFCLIRNNNVCSCRSV